MGTPALAATILKSLAEHHEVAGVFTRPDAVRGRGKKLVASDVKDCACNLGIDVFTPTSFKDDSVVKQISDLNPEAICVSAYGVILPKSVLEIPEHGCLNVHTSLLPRWRGAAPIQRAILAGDAASGVCIMKMEEGLDTGPYCVRKEIAIDDADYGRLTEALAQLGAEALLEAIDSIEAGTVSWQEQAAEGVTYAKKIMKGELALAPDEAASTVVAKIRASDVAHPARAAIAGRSLAIEAAANVEDDQGISACMGMEPGDVRFAFKRLFARAEDAPFEILQVRPDGKKSMDARAFSGGIQGIKNKDVRWERC